MDGKIKEFVVNTLLVSVFVVVLAKVWTWIGGAWSVFAKIAAFPGQGGMGWTVGLALAVGFAVMINEAIKKAYPALR